MLLVQTVLDFFISLENWHLCNFVYFKEAEPFFFYRLLPRARKNDLRVSWSWLRRIQKYQIENSIFSLVEAHASPYMHQNRFVDPVIPLVWRIPTGLWIPIFQFVVIVLEARQNVK